MACTGLLALLERTETEDLPEWRVRQAGYDGPAGGPRACRRPSSQTGGRTEARRLSSQ